MATEKQIRANRNNAKKSTGPRTQEGKARVAQNALKHGLLARDAVLPGEDPEEFDAQFAALEADIQPSDSLEFELVRQIADAQWRMRLLAAAVDETRRHEETHRPERLQPGYEGETLLLGSALLHRTQALVHLARYDGHLSRRFHRAIQQIADLRDAREKRRQATQEEAQPAACVDPRPGRHLPPQAPATRPEPRASASGKPMPSAKASAGGKPTAPTCRSRLANDKTTKQTQFRPTPVESTASGAALTPPADSQTACSSVSTAHGSRFTAHR